MRKLLRNFPLTMKLLHHRKQLVIRLPDFCFQAFYLMSGFHKVGQRRRLIGIYISRNVQIVIISCDFIGICDMCKLVNIRTELYRRKDFVRMGLVKYVSFSDFAKFL